MRVLIVAGAWPAPDSPAAGSYIADGARALAARGHHVRHVAAGPGRGHVRTPVKHASLAARALAVAAAHRPDVLLAHYLVPPGAVARAVAATLRLPYVVVAHGTDVANAHRSPRLRRVTESVVAGARATVAVSDVLAEELQAVAPVPEGRLHVISAGVDSARFHDGDREVAAAAVGWDAPHPRFACVANLVPVKNLERLLEALARLPGGSLAVVGDGPLRATLEERARALGLGARVTFAGERPREETARWLRAADAVCLVSEREGFGLSAAEGLASGRPLAVTRSAGVARLVRAGETGVLCDPLSVDDIARALVEAAALPGGEACIRSVDEVSLEAETARLEAVLSAAVRPPRPAG